MNRRTTHIVIAVFCMVAFATTGWAQSTKEVKWILNTEEPSHDAWAVKVLDEMAARVAQRTEGKFTIRVTVAGELGVKREDIPLILASGKIQMAFLAHGHIAGTVPHLSIYSLPFLIGSFEGITEDAKTVEKAIHAMTAKDLNKLGIGIAFGYPSVPTEIICKQPIEDMSDLKNVKVRAWDQSTSDIISALNGIPVVMSISETYTALQRGVVDAVMTGVGTGMIPMSLQEVAKNLHIVSLAPAYIYIGYNIKDFNKLPADYQKILREEWANAQKAAEKYQAGAVGESLDTMRKAGVKIIKPPADQMEAMKIKVKPLWQKWAEKRSGNKVAYDLVMKAFGK